VNAVIILPTYHDDDGQWRKNMNRLIDSARYLKGFDYAGWSLCFTGYPKEEKQDVAERLARASNKPVMGTTYEPEGKPSLLYARERACQKYPADVFLSIDDDFEFRPGSGEFYQTALDGFKDPLLGVVMCCGHMGAHAHEPGVLSYGREAWWWTNRGLLLRTDRDVPWYFCDEEGQACTGGMEDAYAVFCRMDMGYRTARLFRSPTRHHLKGWVREGQEHAKDRYPAYRDMHRLEPWSTAVYEVIRRRWNHPGWHVGLRTIPRGLR
jgi:hypothetical protein